MTRNPRAHELSWRVLGRSGFKGASAGRHLALPFTGRRIETLCRELLAMHAEAVKK